MLRVAEIESAGRLKSIAEILAAKANPESIDVRHQRARRDRHVRVEDADDGMAWLHVYLPATLAHGIHDRLTQMAKTRQKAETAAVKAAAAGDGVLPGFNVLTEPAELAVADDGILGGPEGAAAEGWCAASADAEQVGTLDDAGTAGASGAADTNAALGTDVAPGSAAPSSEQGGASAPEPDAETDAPRGLDELRADLLSDMLLSAAPTGHGDGLDEIRGYVQITVPVLTAAGVSDEPAILAGHGPMDAATARRIAGNEPGWDRVLTHPISSDVLAVDRYRPSAALRRFLRIRDQHCRFPNCRIPAWRTDADHTVDAAKGGSTRDDNLEFLCEPHHVVKHGTEWRVRQLPRGKLEWTSPTGRVYVDIPERTLLFIADGEPPPF